MKRVALGFALCAFALSPGTTLASHPGDAFGGDLGVGRGTFVDTTLVFNVDVIVAARSRPLGEDPQGQLTMVVNGLTLDEEVESRRGGNRAVAGALTTHS